MPVGFVAGALVILYARCFGVASRDAGEILHKPSQIAFISSEIPVEFGDARARNLLHLIMVDHRGDASGHVIVDSRTIFRSEEHTSELQSLMRISYAVFCLKNKRQIHNPLPSSIN